MSPELLANVHLRQPLHVVLSTAVTLSTHPKLQIRISALRSCSTCQIYFYICLFSPKRNEPKEWEREEKNINRNPSPKMEASNDWKNGLHFEWEKLNAVIDGISITKVKRHAPSYFLF